MRSYVNRKIKLRSKSSSSYKSMKKNRKNIKASFNNN